jgi:hypothetical protein
MLTVPGGQRQRPDPDQIQTSGPSIFNPRQPRLACVPAGTNGPRKDKKAPLAWLIERKDSPTPTRGLSSGIADTPQAVWVE